MKSNVFKKVSKGQWFDKMMKLKDPAKRSLSIEKHYDEMFKNVTPEDIALKKKRYERYMQIKKESEKYMMENT